MKKCLLFMTIAALSLFVLVGCGNADTAGTQARTDLTADHVRGLYSGMVRNDVEDLLGTSDKSLAEHESIEVYSLSDGTTALLRYRDDQRMLKAALVVSLLIFIVFNIIIGNVVGTVADFIVAVTTTVDLWRTREKKEEKV